MDNGRMVYVVVGTKSGFTREDPSTGDAVGAFTREATAKSVRRVAGAGCDVVALVVDHIPAGLLSTLKAFGVDVQVGVQSCSKEQDRELTSAMNAAVAVGLFPPHLSVEEYARLRSGMSEVLLAAKREREHVVGDVSGAPTEVAKG